VAPLFGQIGGGEIDGDAVVGKRKPDGVQRRAHAFTRFAHRLVGEADDIEHAAGARALADMHLHIEFTRLHPFKGNRVDMRQTHPVPTPRAN